MAPQEPAYWSLPRSDNKVMATSWQALASGHVELTSRHGVQKGQPVILRRPAWAFSRCALQKPHLMTLASHFLTQMEVEQTWMEVGTQELTNSVGTFPNPHSINLDQ